MPVRIDVIQEDIDRAIDGCGKCPVENACIRAFPESSDVIANSESIYVCYGLLAERPTKPFRTPFRAKRFMYKFDSGESVEPFAFEL